MEAISIWPTALIYVHFTICVNIRKSNEECTKHNGDFEIIKKKKKKRKKKKEKKKKKKNRRRKDRRERKEKNYNKFFFYNQWITMKSKIKVCINRLTN